MAAVPVTVRPCRDALFSLVYGQPVDGSSSVPAWKNALWTLMILLTATVLAIFIPHFEVGLPRRPAAGAARPMGRWTHGSKRNRDAGHSVADGCNNGRHCRLYSAGAVLRARRAGGSAALAQCAMDLLARRRDHRQLPAHHPCAVRCAVRPGCDIAEPWPSLTGMTRRAAQAGQQSYVRSWLLGAAVGGERDASGMAVQRGVVAPCGPSLMRHSWFRRRRCDAAQSSLATSCAQAPAGSPGSCPAALCGARRWVAASDGATRARRPRVRQHTAVRSVRRERLAIRLSLAQLL